MKKKKTWRFWSLMYSQTLLTASVLETSCEPRNLPRSEETGTTFCMPALPLLEAVFFTVVVEAAPLVAAAFFAALFAAAAMSVLPANAPKTLDGAISFSNFWNPREWEWEFFSENLFRFKMRNASGSWVSSRWTSMFAQELFNTC